MNYWVLLITSWYPHPVEIHIIFELQLLLEILPHLKCYARVQLKFLPPKKKAIPISKYWTYHVFTELFLGIKCPPFTDWYTFLSWYLWQRFPEIHFRSFKSNKGSFLLETNFIWEVFCIAVRQVVHNAKRYCTTEYGGEVKMRKKNPTPLKRNKERERSVILQLDISLEK